MSAKPDVLAPHPPQTPRQVLLDTIRQLSLDAHFSRGALKSAELLASHGGWRGPLAWFRPEGSQADVLQCELAEEPATTRLVSVYLYPLFGELALESTCTCGQALCIHAAALLIRLNQFRDWPRQMTPVQRWQHSIAVLAETPSLSCDARQLREPVCLLGTQGDRPLLTLVAQLVLVEARDGPLRRDRWLSVEDSKAQPYLTRQIIMWQAQLAAGPKRSRMSESGYLLTGSDAARLLAELLEAGICHHVETLRKIRRGPARQPQWQWSLDRHGEARVTLQLPDAEIVELADPEGLRYLDESTGELGRLALARRTWSMLEHLPPIPPAESGLRVDWPPHPALAMVPPPPRAPMLREVRATLDPILVMGVSRHTERDDFVFHLRSWADYGGCRLPLAEEPWRQRVVRRMAREYVTVERDIDRELRARQALGEAGIVALARLLPEAWRTLLPVPDARALGQRDHYRGGAETFTALEAVAQSLSRAGFRLEYDPEMPFAVLPRDTALQATLDPAERPGWTQFQLTAALDGEEIDVLPIVLQGLRRKAFSLEAAPDEPLSAHWLAPLGPERFLPLPLSKLRDWLAPLVECLDGPNSSGQMPLNLSRSQAMALSDCLQRDHVAIQGAHAVDIAETVASLRAAQESASRLAVPTSFRGSLRTYQREGLRWLQALRQSQLGGVLADDMGLGKTVQVIAHLLLEFEAGRLDRPALLVVPTSLVFNWMDEIARFAPALRCLKFTGADRAARRVELRDAPVIITTYALLVNERVALEAIDYSMLVLDEAQWIKNPMTQTARAIRRLRAAHRLAVTGTPLENHLGELWAHFDAVMPGYLGDYRIFNRSFRVPIERHDDHARLGILRQRIAPFLLRRTKAAVAPELPPKTETVLRVSMDEGQRRLYESLRLALSERVREALASYRREQSRIVVLSALLRLRQVCCDPRLLGGVSDPPGSAKLDALLELIRSLHQAGRQILVFSQFTSMLALIAQALEAARLESALLTGKTTDRAAPVRRFQSGEVRILLASLKAGGVGLNLTAADAVVHYDPWWNPAAELQAVDRAHRLGRSQPIFVYKLLCEETIEEKIEAMKEDKCDLAHALLGEDTSPLLRLGDVAVRELFSLDR